MDVDNKWKTIHSESPLIAFDEFRSLALWVSHEMNDGEMSVQRAASVLAPAWDESWCRESGLLTIMVDVARELSQGIFDNDDERKQLARRFDELLTTFLGTRDDETPIPQQH
jgi:hypothetical protein